MVTRAANRILIAGVVAAIGVSVCCVGPVLLALGIGGT